MLGRVAFVSLHQAERLPGRAATLVVSIRDPRYRPALSPGFADVLPLDFDDHDDARDGLDALKRKFDSGHAMALRAWIEARRGDAATYDVLVHCRAGMSRSAAVAWWLHREFGMDLTTRFPAYRLNRHVLRTLNPALDPPGVPAGAPDLYTMMTMMERDAPEAEWPWR
jgi:predicted protein tyrosine phosphatase